jgi:hypothetical protein
VGTVQREKQHFRLPQNKFPAFDHFVASLDSAFAERSKTTPAH